ncbi:MAG: CBS domain-containing protein [Candidatus Moraniibacteriota bacterium]
MLVKDIMSTDIISVKTESSAQAVADIIVQHQIHAVPIVNELFELQGIVAEGDFFYQHSGPVTMASYLMNRFTKKATPKSATLSGVKVSDIMASPCITIAPTATVEAAGRLLVEKNFNTLPVVNDTNTLVGIVTAHDVLKAVIPSA